MAVAWKILAEKYAQEVGKAQTVVTNFIARRKKIEDQMKKLDQLVTEYSLELCDSENGRLNNIGANSLRRQFISEVQQARDGLNQENSMLEIDLSMARAELNARRLEEMKAKKMLERDGERRRKHMDMRERKEFESAALNHFNLKKA